MNNKQQDECNVMEGFSTVDLWKIHIFVTRSQVRSSENVRF